MEKNGWFERLPDDVYMRTCGCVNLKSDVPILINNRWAWMKDKIKDGVIPNSFTKEDAVVYVMELLDANSQWYLGDLTVEEYNEFKKE